MSAHKFTKKELKQDSFVSSTEKVLEFGQRNATMIGVALLVAVVALVGGSYLKNTRAAAAREASAQLYQGQVLLAQGEYSAAMGPLQDCVDDHGGSEFGRYARVALVQAMLALGDTEGALARIQQYVGELPATDPAAADLKLMNAYALADAGRPGEAADAIAATITADLSDAILYDRTVQQADWLIDAGRAGDAINVLEGLDRRARAGEITVATSDLENRLAVAKALKP
ncbi:MAG: tetratricopeptide repeat protein [Candidatus Krumholzibacteriia bacterium]